MATAVLPYFLSFDAQNDSLAARFARGEESAFEELFRRYQAAVYGWIVRIIRDEGVAEELTIEAFLRAHRSRSELRSERHFANWARRIAVNLAIDYVRKNKPEVPFAADAPEVGFRESDSAEGAQVRARVLTALTRLSADERIVATLAYIEECSYIEIAETLDIPMGTVKSRLARATRKLRSHLTDMGISL